nr:MAG TPA: hypothetical protein [Caudoviricetes sp.]
MQMTVHPYSSTKRLKLKSLNPLLLEQLSKYHLQMHYPLHQQS